jgi:hypothetical protein
VLRERWVITEHTRTFHGLRHVRDLTVAPAANLVAEEVRPTEQRAADRASRDDRSLHRQQLER